MGWYSSKNIRAKKKLFNHIISVRSTGKTFDLKSNMVRIAENKKRTVYIRRNASEVEGGTMNEFFGKVQREGYFLEHKFEYNKDILYMDKKPMSYIVPLSTSVNARSMDFLDVEEIYFEEYVLKEDRSHRYLKDEVELFLELYTTIARNKDIPVYFLGNKIQNYNPYFLYFDLKPPKSGIKTYGDHAIEIWDAGDIKDVRPVTRFQKMVSGTRYGDYLTENESLEANNSLIVKHPKNAAPMFDIMHNNVICGVFNCGGNLILSEAQTRKHIYSTSKIGVMSGIPTIAAFRRTPHGKMYINALRDNAVYYTTEKMEQVGRDIAKALYFS